MFAGTSTPKRVDGENAGGAGSGGGGGGGLANPLTEDLDANDYNIVNLNGLGKAGGNVQALSGLDFQNSYGVFNAPSIINTQGSAAFGATSGAAALVSDRQVELAVGPLIFGGPPQTKRIRLDSAGIDMEVDGASAVVVKNTEVELKKRINMGNNEISNVSVIANASNGNSIHLDKDSLPLVTGALRLESGAGKDIQIHAGGQALISGQSVVVDGPINLIAGATVNFATDSFSLPSTRGTASQVLTSDGAGGTSWATGGGGGGPTVTRVSFPEGADNSFFNDGAFQFTWDTSSNAIDVIKLSGGSVDGVDYQAEGYRPSSTSTISTFISVDGNNYELVAAISSGEVGEFVLNPSTNSSLDNPSYHVRGHSTGTSALVWVTVTKYE